MVLLTGQVLNDSLDFGSYASLGAIELEMLYVSGKFT